MDLKLTSRPVSVTLPAHAQPRVGRRLPLGKPLSRADLRARVRGLVEAALAARGEAGRAAAAWLDDPGSEAAGGIAGALARALPAPASDDPSDPSIEDVE